MRDPSYILSAMEAHTIGLAPHYLTIYAAVLGLEAKAVFEFGTGLSTEVILDALEHTGGELFSVSTQTREDVSRRYSVGLPTDRWTHLCGRTPSVLADIMGTASPLDFVLHDGSHAADVVAADLLWVIPRMRQYGLLMLHDTQHSYVGAEVREGLRRGLVGVVHTKTTLPYGFGLTIVRIEGARNSRVAITKGKVGSPHATEPCLI